ncbi:uncharacterized protein BO97DRAFT_439572 [Aspergillus homomorphus CBS 101889]|uniref:Meiosis specific protein SPO22 n=1 Tax=Aspergillus homomorphus (strain CBS 101889) TaxID=1450537 RepID=A0A395ICG9_ASPHC|nr:hypothetical protein BO97DRAFT_439572 [Aspergillus homomorphus CBS 101889]RAL17746.1 hypothetical protein BO97DRAFT_439572 [Aspergillus homomorphus CBS 101889]
MELYFQALQCVFDVMGTSENGLDIILYYISKLQDFPEMHFQALKRLLRAKIADSSPDCQDQILEHVLVRLVSVLTGSHFPSQASLQHFRELAEHLKHHKQAVSEDAQQGCLMMTWRYINRAISDQDVLSAQQWCLFMLEQPVISLSSNNKAKLFRKLLLCASDELSIAAADTIFNRLPEECKTCPPTLYLMYKLALRDSVSTSGSVYLQSLFKSTKESIYIIACIAEAFRHGKINHARQCIQQILLNEKDNRFNKKPGRLLQSMILYFVTELDVCDHMDEQIADAIISVFELALKINLNQMQADTLSISELKWLAKKSYNTALRMSDSTQTERVLNLIELSIKFTTLHGQQTPLSNLNNHYLLCEFFKTAKHISIARQTSNPTCMQTIHYSAAHESSCAFQANINYLHHLSSSNPSPARNNPSPTPNACPEPNPNPTATPSSTNSASQSTWLTKYRIVLALDLEASLHLTNDNNSAGNDKWAHITQLIELSSPILDHTLISIYLDTLLRAESPLTYIVQTIRHLIRTIHTSPSPYLDHPTLNTNLPRYLRVLYQLSLETKDPSTAESVLDQVVVLIRDWKTKYPAEELRWMASVAFNRAVDFYLVAEEGACRRWAGKAIAVAELMAGEDGGALGRSLRGRFGKLSVGLGEEG